MKMQNLIAHNPPASLRQITFLAGIYSYQRSVDAVGNRRPTAPLPAANIIPATWLKQRIIVSGGATV
jgi:hypothetical protein